LDIVHHGYGPSQLLEVIIPWLYPLIITATISSLTIISNDSPHSPIYEAIYIPYIFHIITIFTHLLIHIFTTMIGLTKLSINPGHDFSTACFFTQLARLGDKLHRTERRPNGVATPWKFRGFAWEIHGKIMGKWEIHGKIIGTSYL